MSSASTSATSSKSKVPWHTVRRVSCFVDNTKDLQCKQQVNEIFTGEPIASLELRNKLIKLRFSAETEKGPKRFFECYDIDSLFRWVYQQIYEDTDPVVTPTKNPLSALQIARIKRCYFQQPAEEREWEDLEDFQATMDELAEQRDLEERERLRELYSRRDVGSDASLSDSSDSEDHYDQGIDWLVEQYPAVLVSEEGELDAELASSVYNELFEWLGDNGLLRFDRYTLAEILDDNVEEIRQHLGEQWADLEDAYALTSDGFLETPLPYSYDDPVEYWLQSHYNFRWRESLAPRLQEVVADLRTYLDENYQSNELPDELDPEFNVLRNYLETKFPFLGDERIGGY